MKKIYLILLLLNFQLLAQGIYFSVPTSSSVFYSYGGEAGIPYNFYHANDIVVYAYYARLIYPDGTKSNWQEGEIGGWWVTKAGTYQIEGEAYVKSIFGGSAYWAYRWPFSFSVVDNNPPSAPQNLTVAAIGEEGVSYPKLNWNLNSEDDVEEASQAYYIERRLDVLGNGNWSAWIEIGSENGSTSTYTDYNINDAGHGPKNAQYRIRAKDINNNYSNYSESVEISYGTSLQKIVPTITPNVQESYSLNQNFPNPFNPITRISYSILYKGFVKLKVYDFVGNEIVELVNEEKEKGIYSIVFNGNNLPSGVYIYTIKVNDFVESKRMILLK